MKAFLVGTSGAVLVLIVVGVIYLAWDTRLKAVRGDAAATFIESQIKAQQSSAPKPAEPAK